MKNVLINLTAKQKGAMYYLALFILIWAAFGNTLNHEYNLDDSYYLQLLPEPNQQHSFSENFTVFSKWFGKSNYRPVPAFHLAVEQFFFGQSPKVFHFFNVFYYTILGFLVFYIFNKFKLFDAKWPIFLFTVFFLIHPSHSNVVASIKNRDVILSMIYGLCFIWAILSIKQKNNKIINTLLALLSVIFIALCVGSKVDGILFIPIVGVLLYFLKDVKLKHILIPLVVLVGVVMAFGLIVTEFILDKPEIKATTDFWENPMVSVNFVAGLILNIGLAIHYHNFMFNPKDYFFYYGFNQVDIPQFSTPYIIFFFLCHVAILIAVLVHLYKGKRSRLVMGVIIYFLFMFPFIIYMHKVAGVIGVRYSFNASLGFAILFIGLYYLMYQKAGRSIRNYLNIGLAAIFIVCLYYTVQGNKVWKNKETLFLNDLKGLDKSYMANRMGGIYFLNVAFYPGMSESKKDKYLKYAKKYLDVAKSIYDNDPVLWQNLGKLNAAKGNFEESYKNIKEAIALDSTNLTSWAMYGDFCKLAKDYPRAETAFKKVLSLDNDNIYAYQELTYALVDQRKYEDALTIGFQMIQFPNIAANGYQILGNVYCEAGDTLSAISLYSQSLAMGNKDPSLSNYVNHLKQLLEK